jgi:hypothetical protein
MATPGADFRPFIETPPNQPKAKSRACIRQVCVRTGIRWDRCMGERHVSDTKRRFVIMPVNLAQSTEKFTEKLLANFVGNGKHGREVKPLTI